MKAAYVHVLPLEYYPPARNTLRILAGQPGWSTHVWSSDNQKGLPEWRFPGISVSRPRYPALQARLASRLRGYWSWHWTVARALANLRPDVVVSVEPHSALAVWLYYRVFRGRAALFIHHHEYYAPADFNRPGMRTLKPLHQLEQRYLFQRAVWVSQTNADRLRLLREGSPGIHDRAASLFPNYPPAAWLTLARKSSPRSPSGSRRLIYLGSASFEDTFIRELAEWVAVRPSEVSLHVCGHNVHQDVWDWLHTLGASNITFEPKGCEYDRIPALLAGFDAGIILYKGNTLNFVYNVPNKALEYLACGLEVWYPCEMEGMKSFQRENPEARVRMVNFKELPDDLPEPLPADDSGQSLLFTAEAATVPLIERMEQIVHPRAGGPKGRQQTDR